jgi:sulfur relay (sulfurtransferase) complex TusBCD TusD component (DsrE family)
MPKTLGICVTTSDNMPHLLGLARAANKAKIKTEIFLTGDGVHLTQHESFPELLEHGRVGVCEVSYIARGYRGKEVPGLPDRGFVTQARNAELVEECDRYLVL